MANFVLRDKTTIVGHGTTPLSRVTEGLLSLSDSPAVRWAAVGADWITGAPINRLKAASRWIGDSLKERSECRGPPGHDRSGYVRTNAGFVAGGDKIAGRAETALLTKHISEKGIAESFIQLREGKKYKGLELRTPSGETKNFSSLDKVCERLFGRSYKTRARIAQKLVVDHITLSAAVRVVAAQSGQTSGLAIDEVASTLVKELRMALRKERGANKDTIGAQRGAAGKTPNRSEFSLHREKAFFRDGRVNEKVRLSPQTL